MAQINYFRQLINNFFMRNLLIYYLRCFDWPSLRDHLKLIKNNKIRNDQK